ncbi:hypothetical protein [Leifsonia shinshuensis]
MIQGICLIAFAAVVLLRAPASWRKPAWWATAFGTISIATYGVLWASPTVMDGLLGGRNLLTLLRDTSAIAAMWFFHNAVAAQRGRAEKKLHTWTLFVALAVVVVPFLCIPNPGPTSENFVLDRLSEFPTWLFSAVYISIMGALAARVLVLLAHQRSIMTGLYMGGMGLMVIGSIIELVYLCIAHFGPFDRSFRESYYYASKPPFFGGLLVAVLGVAWVFGLRVFWKYVARWTVRIDTRAHLGGNRAAVIERAYASGWSDRQLAVDSAVNIRDRLKIGSQELSRIDTLMFSGVERLLSLHVERTTA